MDTGLIRDIIEEALELLGYELLEADLRIKAKEKLTQVETVVHIDLMQEDDLYDICVS